MTAVINIVLVGISAIFLSIPVLNRRVFHTINIDEMIVKGREGLHGVQELINNGDFNATRDSALSLIQLFRNDSSSIFVADIQSWEAVASLVRENKDNIQSNLLVPRLDENVVDSIQDSLFLETLSMPVRKEVVAALNDIKNNLGFFVENYEKIDYESDPEIKKRHTSIIEDTIIYKEDDGWKLAKELSLQDRQKLRMFHLEILEKLVYPLILEKHPKRNTDWASEYTVQTAYRLIGDTYRFQFQFERAIEIYDSLIELYPKTIYAEYLFLQIGTMLYNEGKDRILTNKKSSGKEQLRRAIRYLEKIEKNREVARDFPKYKYTDLTPGTYINVDAASKAKRRVREETRIYTMEEEKEELEEEGRDEQGGNTLEDAVKLIGECYIQLGKTDSARSQFSMLLNFFPESDNLDDAQKLIADSYAKDGRLAANLRDSARAAGLKKKYYTLAIKEYMNFVNVYPQSDLISDVYIRMGDAFTRLGRKEEAAEAFSTALDLAKVTEEKAKVQLKIGNYYRERKQYHEAIEAYKVILNTFMSTQVASNAQYLLGDCYRAQGDTAQAIEAYKNIVEYYKQSKYFGAAALKVGNSFFEEGNYREAEKYYNLGYTYDSDNPEAPTMLFKQGMVWVKLAEGQEGEGRKRAYTDAIKIFKKVVDRYKGTAHNAHADQASYQLADCYMKIGREEAAREAAKQIDNRAMGIEAIKIFGVDIEDPEKELEYWDQLYEEAVEDEERATILYDKALVQLDKMNDYDAAFGSLQKILELTDDEVKKINARMNIARIYRARKQYDSARVVLKRLLENRRVAPEMRQQLRIQLYDAAFRADDYEEAIDGFESFAVQFPDHAMTPYAYYRIGTILAEQEKHAEAIGKFETVIEKYPDSDMYDKAVLGKAERIIARGKPEEGVRYLQKLIAQKPLDSISIAPNIYLRIGETFKNELNNTEKAIENFSIIVDSFPHDNLFSYAAFQMGSGLKELGRDDEAIDIFSRVKKDDSAIYRAAQAEIGKLLAKTDPEAAVENYWKIVEESDTPEDSAVAFIGIGDVYSSVKKWDRAAGIFRKVYDFYHGDVDAYSAGALVKLVDALNNAGNYDEAIKFAQIMQEQFPDNDYTINTVYFEAAAWFAKKDYTKARKKFLQIIGSGKSEQLSEIAYYQKADCLYFSKQYGAAIQEYNEYMEKYPEGKYAASALYMQGNAYWTLEDFRNAKNKFQKIVTDYPGFGDICNTKNFLAYCLDRLGKWKSAIKLYNESINSGQCGGSAKKFAMEQREKIRTEH
ncbi:MAG: tetratricopeptide repeat protein [Chitinivibrionales bacterium]|nr:tetratricopeptide repeat protein [Chitinivibrionales bacterium]